MKKTLKFVEDVTYDGSLAHREGEIVELDDTIGYASRWLMYGKAVEVYPEIIEEIVIKPKIVENKKSKKIKSL